MRKVMWLCSVPLPEVQSELGVKVYGGGWLQGISDQLRRRKDIEFHYVFPQIERKRLFKKCVDNISFWGFYSDVGNQYEFSHDRKKIINRVINDIEPDIIHIFGTESAYYLECLQVMTKNPRVIVSIQGLVSELAKVYTKKIPITKQILYADNSNSLLEEKCAFYKMGKNEKTMLKKAENIIGRTDWDRRCVKRVNPNCRYFYCSETLREVFYEGRWDIDKIEQHSIYISQANYPIKGLHIFIEAFSEVVQNFPDAQVYVAGSRAFLESGNAYGKYINELMKKYKVKNRIRFLGGLSAAEVKKNLLRAHITVMPSLMENSPNSIGEAIMLGTPVIAACVGGIPSLVRNEKEALLYHGNSAKQMGKCIKRVFESDDLARRLSSHGRRRAKQLYDRTSNLEKLLKIYDLVGDDDFVR